MRHFGDMFVTPGPGLPTAEHGVGGYGERSSQGETPKKGFFLSLAVKKHSFGRVKIGREQFSARRMYVRQV